MALPQNRILSRGSTDYRWEREALDFVYRELPSSSSCLAWELVELMAPSTGRLYEIDLLVLGHSALYLVEIKSGPGLYKGDGVDWYRDHGGRTHTMDCPYPLANRKAKVLAGMLSRKMARPPFVQAVIFLSHEDVKLDLRADGLTGVVTRKDVIRGLTHHQLPNLERGRRDAVSAPTQRDLAKALADIGIRAKKSELTAGAYKLGQIVEEGPGFQDREAKHRTTESIHARARIYLVPQETSAEKRQSLLRAANREAQLLHELREHPGILRFVGMEDDAPVGPTVFFDAFEGSVRLDQLIRSEPTLPFLKRIDLIAQVGRALGYCHRKSVLHGALNPESVLVRTREDGSLEARLFNFQLGSAERVEGTMHLSTLSAQPWLVYQAPEVRLDPTQRSQQADIFSLGALAYFVLTGQAPAPDPMELDARLAKAGHLDPRVVDDKIPALVGETVEEATKVRWVDRWDSAIEWVELLLSSATEPVETNEPVAALVDPLLANKNDFIATDLQVEGVLGQGASARVLHVERSSDGGEYALKVSLSQDHDDRIRAESKVLAGLRHPRIVERIEERVVGGRASILMTLAGTRTLQRELGDKGPVSLEYALRWGEDLLEAIEYLENEGRLHRDIKPANLGIGSANKKASRLTLFDFSLDLVGGDDRQVGTAAYRDPFLSARPRWDAEADRWSAAITLHEMLTGIRPKGPTPAEPHAPLVLAAERFDAQIRDRLVAFFEKSFARELGQRWPSAEAMRRAYAACFLTSSHPDATEEDEKAPIEVLTIADLAKMAPETVIEALPLTVRAKNALDRAGVLRARDLLRLPDNRISMIRGLGKATAKELHDFRSKFAEATKIATVDDKPFFPNYRGEDALILVDGPITSAMATALADAGIRTLGALASAAPSQIEAIADAAGFDIEVLRKHLHQESRVAEERDRPTTLEGWTDALLPKKAKVVRMLFGVAPAKNEQALPIGASAEDLHRAEGSPTASVYVALSKARKDWAQHPAAGDLVGMIRSVVEESGNAVALEEAARALLKRVPYDRSRSDDDLVAHAAAVVRVASEVERDAEAPRVVLVRVGRAGLWACTSPSVVATLRALGAEADTLARRTPLASATEAQASLTAIAAGSLLELSPDRLVGIAASASETAACSTRLELYPVAMGAERALELTASVIATKANVALTVDVLRERVLERYPESQPLPGRPDLDALVKPHGLVWNDADAAYLRPSEPTATRHQTSFDNARRLSEAGPNEPVAMTEGAITSREFDEKLLRAVEQRELRVLFVTANQIGLAIERLTERLGRPVKRLDRMLIDRMNAQRHQIGVPDEAYFKADREGATGRMWPVLTENVVQPAALEVAKALLPAKEPLVLSHLGLLSRYELQSFVNELAAAARRPECEAILLVVAAHDAANVAPIDGLTVPGLLPSHRLRVPRSWITNEGNARAS